MEKLKLSMQNIQELISTTAGSEPGNLSPIDQGEWSSAYSYRLGEDEFIIRFSHLDEDFHKDKFACRYASSKLPIPKIIQIGEAFGGYYAISEKAAGVAIDFLDSSRMNQVVPAVIGLMDALRMADISATRGFGGWDITGNAPHASWKEALLDIANDHTDGRIHGWKEKLAASSVGIDRFNDLFAQFAPLLGKCPEDRHLIHADLLHYNLLIADSKISAVIDWGCSKYGDFLYELAWFTFWSPWFPSMGGIDFRKLARRHYTEIGLDVPHFDERMKAYELHIGLDSIVYCAFIENWEQAEKVTVQMQKIASS
ncbi:MAG: aminoglycoside phosphotransferase family protein [Anaerolineaceae bacterium]|nr:aminoglycoside phosphotransferase family protein [Anaerolineaceae bacterium]